MPTIALVDDDRNILTSVSIALEAEGYRIMTYTDGASALDGFKTSPPDLAILDIALAQGSGLELLPDLRSRHGTPIPVIVFSVQDAEADNDQVEATLNKARTPFRSLVAAVEDRLALRSSRAFREVA